MPRKQKKLVVSDTLRAFIEKEFQSMLRFKEELKEDRRVKRPELKKKEQRESKRAKRAGDLQWKRPKPRNTRELVIKGKDKPDFNNFVYMCDYLLRKENQEILRLEKCHRSDVHEWISEFLTTKGYKKDDGKSYSKNDIKRIINYQYEDYSPNYQIRDWFWLFFDDMFKSFCNPKLKPSYSASSFTSWEL